MDEYKRKMKEKAEQENSNLWQHPFVDVFKHFKLLPGSDFKQNKKVGDVQEYFVSNSNIFIFDFKYFYRPRKLEEEPLRLRAPFQQITTFRCHTPREQLNNSV
jgi:hypothetical protein